MPYSVRLQVVAWCVLCEVIVQDRVKLVHVVQVPNIGYDFVYRVLMFPLFTCVHTK